jgi:hypothetical protein
LAHVISSATTTCRLRLAMAGLAGGVASFWDLLYFTLFGDHARHRFAEGGLNMYIYYPSLFFSLPRVPGSFSLFTYYYLCRTGGRLKQFSR